MGWGCTGVSKCVLNVLVTGSFSRSVKAKGRGGVKTWVPLGRRGRLGRVRLAGLHRIIVVDDGGVGLSSEGSPSPRVDVMGSRGTPIV